MLMHPWQAIPFLSFQPNFTKEERGEKGAATLFPIFSLLYYKKQMEMIHIRIKEGFTPESMKMKQ